MNRKQARIYIIVTYHLLFALTIIFAGVFFVGFLSPIVFNSPLHGVCVTFNDFGELYIELGIFIGIPFYGFIGLLILHRRSELLWGSGK